jgi:hypothetical protein
MLYVPDRGFAEVGQCRRLDSSQGNQEKLSLFNDITITGGTEMANFLADGGDKVLFPEKGERRGLSRVQEQGMAAACPIAFPALRWSRLVGAAAK